MESKSFLSDILNKYKTYRIASGRNSNSYLKDLHKFERFCVKEYPSADKLSQEMIDKWCCKRETEKHNSCVSRIYPVISLLRYTNSRNLTDLSIPLIPRSIPRIYIPHAFSEEELNNFFQACDSFETKYGLIGKIQRITVPVFFRLLYSSGMRTTEARLLRREDVCLEDGIVNIRYSKGYNQHFVVLHDSMLELMKRYDVAISKMVPKRTFFFPTSSNSGYNGAWVTRIFRKCWYKKNEAYATAYELRHHYAVKNINNWIGQGLTTHQKLLSLSKSMGHSIIESTKYYYSLVPGLYDIIESNTSETLNQIIPNYKKMKQISKEALQLAKYMHDWLNVYTVSIQSNSPHTIRRYSITLSLFVDFLEKEKGIIPLNLTSECFSRKYIEDWIMWLKHSRNSSKETCNLWLSAIRSFLKFLAGKDISYLSLYQTSMLIPMQKTEKRKVTGMTKEAVKTLMSVPDISTKVGLRDLTLLLVLYCTAARINEVLSAKINQLHIDASKPYITVIGKGRKIRTLYILPQAVTYLRKYLSIFHMSNPDPDSFIFYSRNNGTKIKMTSENVNQRLKKYAAQAHNMCNDVPLDLHAHQIRHAKASHWLEDGMNIIQISFLLGHANLETTMVYLDITTEQESMALATLESENEQSIPKKWKMESNSLATFLGIKNIEK